MRLGARGRTLENAARTLCRASQSTIASRNEGLESATLSVEVSLPHSWCNAGKAGGRARFRDCSDCAASAANAANAEGMRRLLCKTAIRCTAYAHPDGTPRTGAPRQSASEVIMVGRCLHLHVSSGRLPPASPSPCRIGGPRLPDWEIWVVMHHWSPGWVDVSLQPCGPADSFTDSSHPSQTAHRKATLQNGLNARKSSSGSKSDMRPSSHSHGATSRVENSATATDLIASDIRSRGRRDSRIETREFAMIAITPETGCSHVACRIIIGLLGSIESVSLSSRAFRADQNGVGAAVSGQRHRDGTGHIQGVFKLTVPCLCCTCNNGPGELLWWCEVESAERGGWSHRMVAS